MTPVAHPASSRVALRALALGLALALGSMSTALAADTLSGELTSRSAVNAKDGSRYQSFPLPLQQGEAVRVKLSGPLSGSLSLMDGQNQLVGGPQDGVLTVVAPRSGRYTLAVSGESASSYGPFQVAIEKLAQRNGGELQSGEDLLGVLGGNRGGNGYTLNVAEARLYDIQLASDEFDTILQVEGPSVSVEDDDSGRGGDTDSGVKLLLNPGQYQITAKGYGESPSGAYNLTVDSRDLPNAGELNNGGALEAGVGITGLTDSNGRTYTLDVPQRSLLRVTMSSSDIDSHLTLRGGRLNITDDDGAGNELDAEIVSLVEPGSYTIKASALRDAGLFTLATRLTPVQIIEGGRMIRPGQTVSKQLRGSPDAATTLQVTEPGEYEISLYSTSFDGTLALRGGGHDETDDDGGSGSNPRLTLFLQPGEYELTAGAYERSGSGDYLLSVQQQ